MRFQVPEDGMLLPNGQRINPARLTYGVLWDRDSQGTAVAAGTYNFLVRGNAITSALETNMNIAGKIPRGYFIIERIGVYLSSATSTPVTASDVSLYLESTILAVKKNNQELWRCLTFMAQGGWGPSGNTTANNTAVVTNGMPSNGLAQALPFPIVITDADSIGIDIIVPVAFTLGAATFVWVVAEGSQESVLAG